MNLIVCVDDSMGMAFNGRRQSMDSGLRNYIFIRTFGKRLLMNEYSAKQFSDNIEGITVSESFLEEAEDGEYCFAENVDISPYIYKTESITLYKWNRSYPSDIKFPVDLSDWYLVSSFEFKGSSHEKITEEVYVRNE